MKNLGILPDQAVEAVKSAAKGITELEIVDSDSEAADEDAKIRKSVDEGGPDEEAGTENDILRKAALDKLEQASEDSLLGQVSQYFMGSTQMV